MIHMYFNFREKDKNDKPSQCFQIRKLENMYLNFREKNQLQVFLPQCFQIRMLEKYLFDF